MGIEWVDLPSFELKDHVFGLETNIISVHIDFVNTFIT
jgi:hypothetical protein